MWEEWLQRILSAHGPEDYAVRRLRLERALPADRPGEEGEAEAAEAAAAPCEPAS